MSSPDSGLRRVAVHADAVHADLALPAGVPVAALIASIVDLMLIPSPEALLRPYRLALPGRAPLDGSKSLAEHAIRDGTILILTHAENRPPQPRFDDPAQQVAAGVRANVRPWTPVMRRLAAALAASGLAGVAGFVAVPGGPGTPNALLAVAAIGTVAVLTVPPSGCGAPARATLCGLAGLAVVAAVAGIAVAATGISAQVLGATTSVAAVGLLRVAGRAAAMVAGLTRQPPTVRTTQAHDLLTGLVAGSSAAVVLGVGTVAAGEPVAGVPRLVGVVFAAAGGAVLALRARSHTDGVQIAALLTGGVAALGIALLTVGADPSPRAPWPAAVAGVLAGGAVVFGFARTAPPPLARRGAEVLEGLTLGALVPLACWVCGVYGTARGLSLD